MTNLEKLFEVASRRIVNLENGAGCYITPEFIILVDNCWPEIEKVLSGLRIAFERSNKIPIEFAEASGALKALEKKLGGDK